MRFSGGKFATCCCIFQPWYCIFQLQILNLGNNDIEELPDVLEHLTMLEKLHLFNNKLKTLTPKVLSKFY